MTELIFEITQEADGGYVAEALGENIATEGDTWQQLRSNIMEAVEAYYLNQQKPSWVRMHLRVDEVLAVA